MREQVLKYHSELTPDVCILQIVALPQEYMCKWGTPMWYMAEQIGDGALLVTFRGGQFRKTVQTKYLVQFFSTQNGTEISMKFIGELFGLPPMTLVGDIDLFMEQKLVAYRMVST